MRQLNKETYEAPLTTRRVVTMESSCMAASNEKVVQGSNTSADINRQEGFEVGDGVIDAFGGTKWETNSSSN